MIYIKKLLNQEHGGFSGLTHWLIAIFLFFLMWLLPITWSKQYVREISVNILFGFMTFLEVGGASLIVDLDSSPLQEGGSTAVYQLGFLGQLLSVGCVVVSGVIWSAMHTKYDEKPPSQHRMFFHAPVMALIIAAINKWAYPSSESTISSTGNGGAITIAVLCSVCIYLGASMLFYKVLKILGKPQMTQIFCLLFVVFFVFQVKSMPFTRLKLMGTACALGYLFHILGDLITKGSAPIFFPIPTPHKASTGWKWQLWWKPYPFNGQFHITTGGAVNIILNFVMTGVDLLLFWHIFIR